AHEPDRPLGTRFSLERIEQETGHRRVQSNKYIVLNRILKTVGPVDTGESGALPHFSRAEQSRPSARIRAVARQALLLPAIPSLSIAPLACLRSQGRISR